MIGDQADHGAADRAVFMFLAGEVHQILIDHFDGSHRLAHRIVETDAFGDPGQFIHDHPAGHIARVMAAHPVRNRPQPAFRA